MEFVTDTHSLIWYLTGNKLLGQKAKKIFQDLEKGEGKLVVSTVVSTVVLFEALVLTEKKKIKPNWKEFWQKLISFPKISFYPIDLQVFQASQKANNKLELHDRILVGTTKLLNAKLITKDKDIRDYGKVKIVW